MKPVVNQGQLTTWNDERGFGFIKPSDGSKEVFLHISALTVKVRRPRVGDTILYQVVNERDGRIRATQASIRGVKPWALSPKRKVRQQKNRRQKGRKSSGLKTIIGTVIMGSMLVFFLEFDHGFISHLISASMTSTNAECEVKVKGNISHNSGRKLYHIPGMEDYAATRIDPARGERWFCSEAEARANGWSRAPR